uniref:Uncharacterized protein LOC114330954 n=1 Tax=Diabrotica virgifera virgifera TaxID=50390 RepID=A0A6P7FN22_DIAVI
MSTSAKRNVVKLFDRPKELVIMPKGDDKTVFDVPKEYITDQYKNVGNQIVSRFGEEAEGGKIPVNTISIPPLGEILELRRDENFSLFLPKHRKIAGQLINIYIGMRNVDDLLSVAVYTRDRVNPYLFNYALSVALLHRTDTQDVDLPSFIRSFPDKYVDSKVFAKAREEANIVPTNSRTPIEIPRDFTASNLEPEHRLAYFREDLGINLHHWHWHLVYPFEAAFDVVNKNRRGELFYYMHQQIVARYNFERLCHGLKRVERFIDWRKAIPEAYFPKLDSLVSSRSWPSRVANQKLSNLRRETDQITQDIDDLERWRDRIFDAIHSGNARRADGTNVALTENEGIDTLGNMIESSILSPNREFYGDMHNMGHVFISYIHDPDHRHLESFGVMGDSATAMRDPVFYRWHSYIDDIFQQFKSTLPRYTEAQLSNPGVTVESVSIESGGTRNALNTFWQQSDVDLSRGMDFQPRGPVFIRFTHLNHQAYNYRVVVNNSGAAKQATCRIFMAPKFDERGNPWLFRDQKNMFIELDRFRVNLRQGSNTITRASTDSSVTIPFDRTFRDLDTSRPDGGNNLAQFNFCGCGWPQHMLIPMGNTDNPGFRCELFVMISNIDDDRVCMRNVDDLLSVAVYTRDRVNPYLFNYALSVALLHRADTQDVDLPSFIRSFPDKYVDSKVFAKAREEANIVPTNSRTPIEIPRDFTASNLEPEHRLAYFREDLGINLHHWHWHLVYPFEAAFDVVNKNRRGELFYYMHQQIVARYNYERLCHGLKRVERFIDWRKSIPEAYFPKLDSLVSSRSWPSRVANQKLSNLRRETDQIVQDIDDLERWRDRIFNAIQSGNARRPDGTNVALTENEGIDILGNMIESSILSPNRDFYGDMHNMGHVFISYIHDPDHRHLYRQRYSTMSTSAKNNVVKLFDRPKELVIMPKGNDQTVFDVPSDYIPDQYKSVGNQIVSRFGEEAQGGKIPVNTISIPPLGEILELRRDENFSLFLPKHRKIAGQLINIFIGMRNVDDLLSVAVYTRDRVNPYLFNYALSVALLHRADTQDVDLPSFIRSFPDKYVDSRVFAKAREEANIVPTNSRTPIEIPRDFTASNLEPEHRLAYFREDLGINLHHWHWHLVYPFEAAFDVVNKNRRGELFYYMHQQIVARYNYERLCHGLKRVERFIDWRKAIPEAYFPKLDSLVSSRSWPARVANQKLSNLRRETDQITQDIDDLERWRDRIFDAIHSGNARRPDGTNVALTENEGIDILGNMIESSILSPNREFYGDMHNMGHVFISYIHDPDHRHLFGVMGDSATAMRDPVFYRWHSYIDDIFQQFKSTLPRYTEAQLSNPGVTVESVSIESGGGANTLNTFWQQSDVDLSRGMDFQPRGAVFVRFTHLNHQEYNYRIVVNNSGAAKEGTCRIFMAPKFDERGNPWLFKDQKNMFIELDRFRVNLRQGQNTIMRASTDSSVTIPFNRTFRDLDTSRPDGGNNLAQFNFCGCGWPQHMLIPGVDQDISGICNDADSFCGVKDRLYPDRRSMGYPFDRQPRENVDTLQQFLTPNMRVQDVVIKFSNRTFRPRQTS